jgi:hypothetical protein
MPGSLSEPFIVHVLPDEVMPYAKMEPVAWHAIRGRSMRSDTSYRTSFTCEYATQLIQQTNYAKTKIDSHMQYIGKCIPLTPRIPDEIMSLHMVVYTFLLHASAPKTSPLKRNCNGAALEDAAAAAAPETAVFA